MSTYERAAMEARRAIFGPGQPDREELRVLVKTARDLAPDAEQAAVWERYAVALSPGHKLGVKAFPMTTVTVDGVSPETIEEIEQIFSKETDA